MINFLTASIFIILSAHKASAQKYIDIDLSAPTPPSKKTEPETPPKLKPKTEPTSNTTSDPNGKSTNKASTTPPPNASSAAQPSEPVARPTPQSKKQTTALQPSEMQLSETPKVNAKPVVAKPQTNSTDKKTARPQPSSPPVPSSALQPTPAMNSQPVRPLPNLVSPTVAPAKKTTEQAPVPMPLTPAVTTQTKAPIAAPPNVPSPPATKPIPKLVPLPSVNAETKNQMALRDEDDRPRFKNRHAFEVDYTTWYETIKLKNKNNNELSEANSHYFGVALNYDFTVYREKFGYALTLGSITGNAQAGTKDSGDYYERRIVWTGFRAGGRLFFRANNRVDLGLGFMAQSKSTKWPQEEIYSVVAQPNPQYFYYVDTRWRLNYRYEVVQAFGAHLRSYALAWMLGINYTLN